MRNSTDAFDYYQQVMRKNAKRREGSGLGLARICAEAEMAIDCEVEEDRISIRARAALPAAGSAT
jgi:hypothetical protein